MNRSLPNVLFGGLSNSQQSQKKIEGEVTQINVEETVDSLANAESVIIVSISISSWPYTYAYNCRLLATAWP